MQKATDSLMTTAPVVIVDHKPCKSLGVTASSQCQCKLDHYKRCHDEKYKHYISHQPPSLRVFEGRHKNLKSRPTFLKSLIQVKQEVSKLFYMSVKVAVAI